MSGLSRSSAASPEPYESPRRTGERRENGVISPAPSTFSFDHEEPGPQGLRFRPDQTNEKHVSRKASRGTGVDGTLLSVVKPDPQTTSLSKKKSQFYSEVFAYREPNITIRSKVHQYSVITAELKTNIIVSLSVPPNGPLSAF